MRSNLKQLLITGLAALALIAAITPSPFDSESTSKTAPKAPAEQFESISTSITPPALPRVKTATKSSEGNSVEARAAAQPHRLSVAGKNIGAGGYAQAMREVANERNPEMALEIANQVMQCRNIELTTEAAHRFKNTTPAKGAPESHVINGLVHQAELRSRACQTLTPGDQHAVLELLRYAAQNNIRSAATAYYIEAYVQGQQPEHWETAKSTLLKQASAGDLEAMFYVLRNREIFTVSDIEARAMALVLEDFSQRPVDFASPHALIVGRLHNEGFAHRPLPVALEAEAMRRKAQLLAAALPPEPVTGQNAGE
jgi:hypothetical protein